MADFVDLLSPGTGPVVTGIAKGAVSSGTLSVSVGGTVFTVKAARDLTVSANDTVLMVRLDGNLVAISRLGGSTPDRPDLGVTPTPTVPQSGTLVVHPVETRSYRPTYGWRTDNDRVYQGQYGSNGNHVGCAFYGDTPRSLAGATVTACKVYIRRPANTGSSYGASQMTLAKITESTRPGGAPTVAATATGPLIVAGAETLHTVTTSWGQDLVNGTAGGLGLYDADGSPYLLTDGVSTWGAAWTLLIDWTR